MTPENNTSTNLQLDNLVEGIGIREIGRDVLNKVLPPVRRGKSMENGNRAKVKEDWRHNSGL